ncbi:MAG: TolC family protein [Candidatus Sericytochromatia bacterium]|nr:TolC family protein [Candidatus Tanganyikabacteria bacterium]
MIVPILAVALAAPAAAEAPARPPAPGGKLTLAEAVRLAVRYSPALAASEARLAQAGHQIAQTRAGVYPQVSLSASALNFRQIDANAISSFGGGLGGANLGGFAPPGGSFNFMQTGVAVSQTLFDGFQTADALAIADATLGMNEVDLANQRRKAAYDAASAYFAVLRAERLARNARDAARQTDAHVAAATVREKAGTGTRFEILQAETQRAAVRGQVRAAENAAALARLNLGNVIGEDLGDRAPETVLLPEGAPGAVAEAVERRPEVQTLAWKRRLDEAAVDLSRKANLPRVSLNGNYSQQGFTSGRSLSVTMGLQWNLIDWGKADAKVAQTEKDLAQTDLLLAQARRNLAADVQGAVLSRQDARDRLEIAERGAGLAREAHRMAEVRYRAGIGTSFDVIDAQTSLLQAENSEAQARFDTQLAEIRLAQALGVELAIPGESP